MNAIYFCKTCYKKFIAKFNSKYCPNCNSSDIVLEKIIKTLKNKK